MEHKAGEVAEAEWSTKQEHLLEELAVVQVQTLSITPILLLLLLNLTPYNQSLKTKPFIILPKNVI